MIKSGVCPKCGMKTVTYVGSIDLSYNHDYPCEVIQCVDKYYCGYKKYDTTNSKEKEEPNG